MNKQTPEWLSQYQQPYRKRKAVDCHSGHRHTTNTPAAGLVLVRLNAASQLELLLDLRGPSLPEGGSYAFIGGNASTVGEAPQATALREAREEYNIEPTDINLLGIEWKSDHGGYRYLHYTYVFAEYNPPNGKAPAPQSFESTRSDWFNANALPSNLIRFINQDRQMLEHILHHEIRPMLLNGMSRARSNQVVANTWDMTSLIGSVDEDGDSVMSDAAPAPPVNTAPQTSPHPQFEKCASLHASSDGKVEYPKLPTPAPSTPQSSNPVDSKVNARVTLASNKPSAAAVAELVFQRLPGDKDFFDLAETPEPEMENKMQIETTAVASEEKVTEKKPKPEEKKPEEKPEEKKTEEKKTEEKKPEEPAKKAGFSQFLTSRFWGPSELTTSSEGVSAKQDNTDKPKAEPKAAMPTPETTPEAAPQPAMKPAASEKKEEKEKAEEKKGEEKTEDEKKNGDEKKDEASNKPSLFSRFFGSTTTKPATKPAEQPAATEPVKAEPVKTEAATVKPEVKQETAPTVPMDTTPAAADTEKLPAHFTNEALEKLSKTLMAGATYNTHSLPPPLSGMGDFVPGHAYNQAN